MFNISFLVTSLVVIIIPGTGVIYTITTSLSSNKQRAILAAFGCTLGIIPHITAAILGISAVMNTGAIIFKIIKIIGIIYLLYISLGLLRNKKLIEIQDKDKENYINIIIKAVLINLLNPKLTLFFFSFLPQFIDINDENSKIKMISLGLIFMVLTFIIFCIYGLLANLFKKVLMKSPIILKRIEQSFGILLIGFAGKLAFED